MEEKEKTNNPKAKEKVTQESLVTGITESLEIEGITVDPEIIKKDIIDSVAAKRKDGTDKPQSKSNS